MEFLGLVIYSIVGALFLFFLSGYETFGLFFLWGQKKFGFPRNIKTGSEGLIGQQAIVTQLFVWDEQKRGLRGKVRLNGELWLARFSGEQKNQISLGERVQVEAVDSIVLVVRAL